MKKLLDVGCGPGTISNIGLYHELKHSYQIYGIDQERESVLLIKKRFPSGIFTTGNAEKLHFPKHSFDAVIARHVLEHVKDQRMVIAEIHRVSKKGAKITIAVPHPFFEHLNSSLTPHYLEKGHHHQRVYTKETLVSLLTNNGFRIESVKNDKWPLFVIVLLLASLARITKKISMQEQSGVFLVGTNNYLRRAERAELYLFVYAVLHVLNTVFFFLNYIIPFEIYVIASKK